MKRRSHLPVVYVHCSSLLKKGLSSMLRLKSVQQFLVFLNPFDHKNVLPPPQPPKIKITLVYPIPVRNLDVKNRRLKNSYLLDVPKTVDRKSHSWKKTVGRKNHSRSSIEKVSPASIEKATPDRRSKRPFPENRRSK